MIAHRLFGATIIVVAAMAAGCGGVEHSPGRFTQTWTKSYATTTCPEWSSTMDDHQRFVMAGDILLTARKKAGNGDIPPDELIAGFASDISSVCSAKFGQLGGLVIEAAWVVYLDERFHP